MAEKYFDHLLGRFLFTVASIRIYCFYGSVPKMVVHVCSDGIFGNLNSNGRRKKYDIAKYSLIYIGIILAYFVIIKFIRFDAAGTQIIYHPGRLLLFVAIAILGPSIILLLVKTNKFNYNLVLSLVCLFALITTGITLKLYRTGSDTASYMNDFNIGSKLKRNDQQYRYNTSNNLFTLTGNASGIGAFSSTVENSSKEFDALFDWYSSNSSKTNFNDKNPEGLLLGGKYIISSQQDGRKILEKVSEEKKTYYIESQKLARSVLR